MHKHLAVDTTVSPLLWCLPITKEVINSTTATSREIDFNDTSYMTAVSVPDSHLYTSRVTQLANPLLLSMTRQNNIQQSLLSNWQGCIQN